MTLLSSNNNINTSLIRTLCLIYNPSTTIFAFQSSPNPWLRLEPGELCQTKIVVVELKISHNALKSRINAILAILRRKNSSYVKINIIRPEINTIDTQLVFFFLINCVSFSIFINLQDLEFLNFLMNWVLVSYKLVSYKKLLL